MTNTTLQRDFERVCNSVDFSNLRNKTVLITGATGLIGSLLVKTLLYCNRKLELNMKVLACVRSAEKSKVVFSDCEADNDLQFIYVDFSKDEFHCERKLDFIIHAAAITNSRYMISNPVETAMVAINGTNQILAYAAKHGIKSVVYISSMEVYGQLEEGGRISENDLGFIDLSKPRSSYPESKRMCECICAAYASQYNLNVKVVRLAQTFGAGISREENRVFAQFAKSVINGDDIVLHTSGQSEGNYVYTSDAIAAILLVLQKEIGYEVYNVSNENSHMKICEMAEMVAQEIANAKIKVVYDIPSDYKKYGYAPETKLWLDCSKIRALGWNATVSLKESYIRMIEYMRTTF